MRLTPRFLARTEERKPCIAGKSNGDINCDGSISVADLLLLIADWGSCELCAGDLNNDGETNVHDLLILIANWG
jgi:hypothetical protein